MQEIEPVSETDMWLILVNPVAGSGLADNRLDGLSDLFRSNNIQHEIVVSDSYEQLFEYASSAASSGYKGIVAHGGDGTVSRIAAGIIQGKTVIPLSVFPGGSGNDWARNIGILSFNDTIESILRNHTIMMDAACCEIEDANAKSVHSSVFINSAGIGLDAHVLRKALILRKKIRIGRLGYISALVSTVLEMPIWKGRMSVDGTDVYTGSYLSLTSGVCPYTGGSMQLSPSSNPFDDMLDTSLIKPISRANLIRSVPMLYKGSILDHPAVDAWRGGEFSIKAEGSITVELDGEFIDNIPDNSTVTFKSLPSAIGVRSCIAIGVRSCI